MPHQADRSETVQIDHPTRSAVVIFYAERVLEETPMTWDELAEQVALEYERRVPEHARTVKLAAPRSGDYHEFARELGAASTRMKRYIRGGYLMPSDLEEAIAYVLPAPYGLQCRRALARRYGFLGAERLDPQQACAEAEMISGLCNGTAAALRDIGAAMADNTLDADDLALAPSMMRDLDDMQAHIESMRALIIERTGYQPGQKITAITPRASGSGAA